MSDEMSLRMEADAEATAERLERLGYVSCKFCGEMHEVDDMRENKGVYCCEECFDNHDHDENCDCGGFATVGDTLDHDFESDEEEANFIQYNNKHARGGKHAA